MTRDSPPTRRGWRTTTPSSRRSAAGSPACSRAETLKILDEFEVVSAQVNDAATSWPTRISWSARWSN